ncbi:hypothetical protein DE146DRAFT_521105 [Phaeosphaeria sp. MPI-PUGE-AT-0046c]|nr:hypothetical protein DE146DRAFT_521105 [Phaeosphaeria sp. MPI-PUGE-AT-0046c]
MILASYLAGSIVLAILSLLFLVARHQCKRSKDLPWSVDDTLLVFSLMSLYLLVAIFSVTMSLGHIREHLTSAMTASLRMTLVVCLLSSI